MTDAQLSIEDAIEVKPPRRARAAKTEVVKVETPPAPVAEKEDGALILSMIDRLAATPDMPIERVEQMFALYQRVEADKARRAYDAAFAEMQHGLPIIERKGKSHHGAYGRWEDIVEHITPVIGKHGFAISFRVANEPGTITVTATLSHRGGHREETSYSLPADKSGSKNEIQAIGSTTSYGKRYAACALLNVVTRDEDKDGNSGDPFAVISDEQAEELRELIGETMTDISKFLAVAKAESLSDVLAVHFPRLKALLMKKKGDKK